MRSIFAQASWLPASTVLVVIGLAAGPVGEATDRQVAVHEVRISVDASTGQFSYSLDPVNAAPGDQIEWICEQGNWSVHFIGNTPLPQQAVRGQRASARRLPVRPDAAEGSYKYFVAVAIGDDIFTDDPEVIVGPRG